MHAAQGPRVVWLVLFLLTLQGRFQRHLRHKVWPSREPVVVCPAMDTVTVQLLILTQSIGSLKDGLESYLVKLMLWMEPLQKKLAVKQ